MASKAATTHGRTSTPPHSRQSSTATATPPRPLSHRSSSTVTTAFSNASAVRTSGTTTPVNSYMGAQESLNPHTAADLLRQAMMHSRTDDDAHEHVGPADSAPASGVVTPRPDLSDKRLPSIMHSYFGQVRARSTSKSNSSDAVAPVTPALDMSLASQAPRHRRERTGDVAGLPTAASSPHQGTGTEQDPVSFMSDEQVEKSKQQGLRLVEGLHDYPTPPLSSSSSLHQDLKNDSGANGSAGQVKGSRAATALSSKRFLTPGIVALKARRHTFTVPTPPSSTITPSTVHAVHFSNPAHSSTPTTPTKSPHSSHRSSASSSYSELKRLTESVVALPRKKSTPPQTPRTSSQDGVGAEQPGTVQTSSVVLPGVPSVQGDVQGEVTDNGKSAIKEKPAAAPRAPSSAAAVGPPKGKMSVTISEARGLKPSSDPYVVCVFECNEYISKGPRTGDMDVDRDGGGSRDDLGALPIRPSGSDMGRSMAIPMKSRQSSTTSLNDHKDVKDNRLTTDPTWNHKAIFDVVNDKSEIDVSVYDRSAQEIFLGHVRICPELDEEESTTAGWFKLESRDRSEDSVSGEINLRMTFQKIYKKHYGPTDFQILKLIGKGTFGQVYQVRKKDTQRIYAMKVLSKKVIVQKKEVAHTVGERNILVRTAMTDSPFIVGLKFSFQTSTDLYLVTDYMSGGELFWHLQKEGRFNERRAKFYIAELILALQHLHQHDIVYRDLKPENILLDANGHVALCDFGLSKANLTKNDTTNTFCGTTEYLAPEVLLDEQGYTKMVDFWSLGVLVFEMCCGWSPFYADDTQQMYKNIAFGKVRFPKDALSTEGRNFVKGLLNRNPKHRLGANDDAEELKAHPFFEDVDWKVLARKDVAPPFKPKLKSELDTSNFDPEFTNALNGASSLNARAAALASGANPASTPLSPGMQANFKGFTFVDESAMDSHFGSRGREKDELERMDEDDREDDLDWDDRASRRGREDRMSGIVRTGGEHDIFDNSNFDI